MKLWTLIIFSFTSATTFSQSYTKFNLSLSTFNHAEWIMDGSTTYVLNQSEIKVINTAWGAKKGKVVFSKIFPTSQSQFDSIIKIKLDTLEELYTNWCVMTTSGNEYFLNFSTGKKKVEVSLHHYYLKQLDDIVEILNSLLPERFQLSYLPKDTKQDCNP